MYRDKEKQREYAAKNRKKVTKMIHDLRKRNAEKFKAEGQMYYYLSKTERQNKMVEHLCKKTGISKEYSRQVLEENNWNIKALLKGGVVK